MHILSLAHTASFSCTRSLASYSAAFGASSRSHAYNVNVCKISTDRIDIAVAALAARNWAIASGLEIEVERHVAMYVVVKH